MMVGGAVVAILQIRRIAEAFPDHIEEMADAYHVIHGALATSRDRKVVAVMKEHYAQIEKFFVAIVQNWTVFTPRARKSIAAL